MTTVSWLIFVAVLMFVSARLGYLAGREAAESRCAATIADLRIRLKRASGLYSHAADDRRPE